MLRLPALVATLLIGCGTGSGVPVMEPEPELPPLPEVPLLVPRGASAILVAHPDQLLAATATRLVIDAVASAELRDAFARRTGVEPGDVTEVVVSEHGDDGFILLARGRFSARDVVRAAERRMNTVDVRQDRPFVRRGGYFGRERRELVALDRDLVLMSAGAMDALAAVVARARHGQWPEGASAALAAPELAPLLEMYADAPLSLFVPQPLALPAGSGASLLLSRQRALGAALRPASDEMIELSVELVGEFPEGAADNFRTWIESVGSSELGAALGISEAARTLTIRVDASSAVLRAGISSDVLAAGLRMLFTAELEELLALATPAP